MFKAAILILAAICAVPLCAGTISIVATANSELMQSAPDTHWLENTGADMIIANWMPEQEYTDIFRFSLSALPTGATITGAKFWLFDTGWNDTNSYPLYWHPDSSWDAASVTWNTFSKASNVLVGSRDGSAGWQYNGWNIDVSAWGWAADVTQGAVTFELREGYGNFSANQNNFYTMLAAQEHRPYLELEYRGNDAGDPQVPEPGSFALLGGGLAAAAAIRVRRSRSADGGTRS